MKVRRFLPLGVGLGLLVACTPAERTDDETARLEAVPGDTAPARTVHVVLNEWSVSPSEAAVDAGAIHFHAMNEGQFQHALRIEGGGQEHDISNVGAGGTGEVTANLTAGTYTLYCPIVDDQGNHRERGMSTTFTVR